MRVEEYAHFEILNNHAVGCYQATEFRGGYPEPTRKKVQAIILTANPQWSRLIFGMSLWQALASLPQRRETYCTTAPANMHFHPLLKAYVCGISKRVFRYVGGSIEK